MLAILPVGLAHLPTSDCAIACYPDNHYCVYYCVIDSLVSRVLYVSLNTAQLPNYFCVYYYSLTCQANWLLYTIAGSLCVCQRAPDGRLACVVLSWRPLCVLLQHRVVVSCQVAVVSGNLLTVYLPCTV